MRKKVLSAASTLKRETTRLKGVQKAQTAQVDRLMAGKTKLCEYMKQALCVLEDALCGDNEHVRSKCQDAIHILNDCCKNE